MNEEEWLGCDRLPPLLDFFAGPQPGLLQSLLFGQRRQPQLSWRKQRLFLCACLRLNWSNYARRGRETLELAERHADGQTWWWQVSRTRRVLWAGLTAKRPDPDWSVDDLATSYLLNDPYISLSYDYNRLWGVPGCEKNEQVAVAYFRDVSGNPFRFLALDPTLRAWNANLILRLAQTAYNERQLPSGHLDAVRLAVLADALEDAGCSEDALLVHLRSPEPHIRGCWAIDLLTGRE